MNNKKYIGAFFAILMTLCLFAAGQIVSAQSPVVQTVNGVEFTADQYIESAQFYRFNLIQQYNYYLTICRMYGLEVGSDLNDQFEEILGPDGADKVREVVLSNAARQVIIAAEAEKAGALALILGGPGAVFWMWIVALQLHAALAAWTKHKLAIRLRMRPSLHAYAPRLATRVMAGHAQVLAWPSLKHGV